MDSRGEKKKRKKDGDDQKKVKRKRALVAVEKDSSTTSNDAKKSLGMEGMKAAEDDISEMPPATGATKVKRKKGKENDEKGYNQTTKGSSKIAGKVEVNVAVEEDSGIPLKASTQSLSMEARNATEDDIIEMPSTTLTINKKRKKSKEKDEKVHNQTTKGSSKCALNVEDKITENSVLAAEAKGNKEAYSMMKGKGTDDYEVSNPKKIIKSSKDDSDTSALKKKKKKVTFSNEIEVFYIDTGNDENAEGPLVQGKQFTIEEDNQVMKAIDDYIQKHQLGEEGIHMILNYRKYPQVKNCWKEIGACVPYQPYMAIYYRANCLLERCEKHKWEPEESEMVQRFRVTHGADWKTFAGQLNKHRIHLKDCWRRIKFTNRKRGPRSQDEYQSLFDLVNMDLRLKAFEEIHSKHDMIRNNISWTAIGDELTSRNSSDCCIKWYKQLTSPLVNEGLWEDVDDYQLLAKLQNVDACCVEDVDWDNLLEHRSGEVCRNRWGQMTRHIGGFKEKPFIEQLEVLAKRYSSDMIEYREMKDSVTIQ